MAPTNSKIYFGHYNYRGVDVVGVVSVVVGVNEGDSISFEILDATLEIAFDIAFGIVFKTISGISSNMGIALTTGNINKNKKKLSAIINTFLPADA